MRVLIRVAGRSAPWAFRDGERLGEWVAGRPWLTGPRLRVARLADRGGTEPVLAAVQAAVAASDLGASAVSCRRLDSRLVADRGFEAALQRALGVDGSGERYRGLERAAQRLGEQPRLLLLPPLAAERPQTADEAAGCPDLLGQLVPGVRVAALLLDTRRAPYTGPAFDLTAGEPTDDGGWLSAPAATQWAHYLHVRVAWEAARDPVLAADLGTAAEQLPIGADEGLEAELTRASARALPGRAAGAGDRLQAGLEAAARPGPALRAARQADLARLAADGLFWSPGELGGLAPSPWVARALLAEQPGRAWAEYLRGCVVCAPLARELLSRCLQLEARERGRLVGDGRGDPGEEARRYWEDFTAGRSLSADLYPAGSPARPAGAWAFASFGEVLAQLSPADPRREPRYQLLYLRNHLAHGHYAGWKAVRALDAVIRALNGPPA